MVAVLAVESAAVLAVDCRLLSRLLSSAVELAAGTGC